MVNKRATFKVKVTSKNVRKIKPKTISNVCSNKRISNRLNYSTTEFATGPLPSTIFTQNSKLIEILRSALTGPQNRNIKPPSDILQKGNMNAFIAFRTYYSQFGAGLKQNILSGILSKFWRTSDSEQKIWTLLAEQFSRKS